MRDGELPQYNRRSWEPLWAVCEELGMPLVTHVGGGTNARYSGLESVALLQLESAMFSRRVRSGGSSSPACSNAIPG